MDLGIWDCCAVIWVSSLVFVLVAAVMFKRFLWALAAAEVEQTKQRRLQDEMQRQKLQAEWSASILGSKKKEDK